MNTSLEIQSLFIKLLFVRKCFARLQTGDCLQHMTYNRIQGQYNTENIPTSHLWGVFMCITNPDTKWKSDFGEKDN